MAKKPPVVESENEIENENIYDTESLNPTLETLYAEMGITGDPDTTVHVAKLDADGKGNEANVWKGDPEQYDLESLAKKFGSGSYRVMIYIKNTDGRKVRKANKIIAWLLSPEDEAKRIQIMNNQSNPAPVTQQQPQQDIVGAMREMMAGFQSTLLQTVTAIQSQQPKEKDPLQTLEGIEKLAKIMIPPQQPQQDSFATTMKMMDTFMTFQERLKPEKLPINDDGEVSIPALLLSAVREFKSMNANKNDQPKQLPVSNEIKNDQNGLTPEQQAEIDEMNIVLKFQLKQANNAASNNVDPAEYAESIYTLIPDDVLQMIATDEKWFDEIVKLYPDCKVHEAWYKKVGEKIIGMMREDGLLQSPVESGNVGQTLAGTPPNDGNNAGSNS